MSGLLILAWLLPMLLAPWAMLRNSAWIAVPGPLAALLAAFSVDTGSQLGLEWLLLGSHMALDPVGKSFLLFSAVIWLFAGLYSALIPGSTDSGRGFHGWFLLAMSGNFLLILAGDAASFYFGYALMGLAAFGLVAHRRSQRASCAGRIYLIWTLAGELAVFSALVFTASQAESLLFSSLAEQPLPAPAVLLLLVGFGIKLALPGLHFWLPRVYATAPAVSVAVLSGPMFNAGLLGWLRFLPPQGPALGAWADTLFWAGLAGVALGAAAGLLQRDPRAVLGYSSIVKTGVVAAVFGIVLTRPDLAPALIAALVLFAMHHLVLKGALFLGLEEWERSGTRFWVFAILTLLALALAGAPWTGGAAAKAALSDGLAGEAPRLSLLLGLSALASVLLLARFLWLVSRRKRPGIAVDGASLVWVMLALLAAWLPFAPWDTPWSGSALVLLILGAGLWLLLPKRSPEIPRWLPGMRKWMMRVASDKRPQGLGRIPGVWQVVAKGSGIRSNVSLPALVLGGILWLCVFVLLLGGLLESVLRTGGKI